MELYTDTNKTLELMFYHSRSDDNKKYSAPICLVAPTENDNDWDGTGLYRSSLLYDSDGSYSLYYTGINGETGTYPDTENVGIIFWKDH